MVKFIGNLVKRMRLKARQMAKNKAKSGKSTRRGNSRSPYAKYNKTPFRYSDAYYTWKRGVINNKNGSKVTVLGTKQNEPRRQSKYLEAAE